MNAEKETTAFVANKYKIGELISRGSFGAVFRGNIKGAKTEVAIKFENPNAMKSLKHETKILNYLYSNKIRTIPAIYWYGLYGELPCLVIPYYKHSLTTYIERRGTAYLNKIMVSILDILKHIHRQFVIHRDLKPENFMINAEGNIVLIDFGLATFYVGEDSHILPNLPSETIVGTPKYISIRIFEGNRYTTRDDLISLGYIYAKFYLGGQTPWEPTETLKKETDSSYNYLHIHHPLNISRKEHRTMDMFKKWLQDKREILDYFEQVYLYSYDESPDYDRLMDTFRENIA